MSLVFGDVLYYTFSSLLFFFSNSIGKERGDFRSMIYEVALGEKGVDGWTWRWEMERKCCFACCFSFFTKCGE